VLKGVLLFINGPLIWFLRQTLTHTVFCLRDRSSHYASPGQAVERKISKSPDSGYRQVSCLKIVRVLPGQKNGPSAANELESVV
jgi:hypothetical protein